MTMTHRTRSLLGGALRSRLSLTPWRSGFPVEAHQGHRPVRRRRRRRHPRALVGQELSRALKQPVDRREPGRRQQHDRHAAVATSPKDGYTLGLATPVFVMTPSLMKNHPYDSLKDFVPVAMIGFTPMVLVVHPSVPAKTTQEFIALAKAKPGTLNFASLGAATTQGLAASMFNFMAGVDAVAIATRAVPPA
jgi:hypothetical protein